MLPVDFVITQGDTLPVLTDSLTYSDGNPIDLTDATVNFVMRAPTATSPKINTAATIVDAPAGQVSYSFSGTDSGSPGLFNANWLVTFSGGGLMTFPTVGSLVIEVRASLSITGAQQLCALDDVKSALKITDSEDDDRLALAIDAASRLIEEECGRRFYQESTVSARLYVANDPWLCEVDDFATTDGLIIQTDYAGDGSFDTTWESQDYQLEPINALEYEAEPWPFTKVRAVRSLYFPVWGGIAYPKPFTQALVRVTAQWGWLAIPSPITKAAIVQSIALFKADDVPFGATPFGETGVVRLRQALHPTAALLVRRYMNNEIYVA